MNNSLTLTKEQAIESLQRAIDAKVKQTKGRFVRGECFCATGWILVDVFGFVRTYDDFLRSPVTGTAYGSYAVGVFDSVSEILLWKILHLNDNGMTFQQIIQWLNSSTNDELAAKCG